MTIATPSRQMRPARSIFLAVVGFTFAAIVRPVDSSANLWSRTSLTFSIVERGTLNIDPYLDRVASADWSYANGHYYSNKAPGPSLMAVPLYAGQRAAQRVIGLETGSVASYRFAAWLANLVLGVLPTLVGLGLFWRLFEQRYGFSPRGAFGMTALAAVASLSFPYTTFLFGHQTAAAFLMIGVALTLLPQDRETNTKALFTAGLCFGIAVLADHLAILGVLIWSVWVFWNWRHQPRVWLAWAAGGLGPAAVLLWYNAAAFGSTLTGSYAHAVVNPRFEELGLLDWHAPSLVTLAQLTVGPPRGWFYATPVFALIIAGVVIACKERRHRPELLFAAAAVLAVLAVLASWNSWHGGWSVGPRYIVWALPFATLLLVPVARRAPHVVFVLALISAVLMLAVAVTDPLLRSTSIDPFVTGAWPILRGLRDTPTVTVWSLFGASPAVSFLLFLTMWLIAGRYIDRQLSRAVALPLGAQP